MDPTVDIRGQLEAFLTAQLGADAHARVGAVTRIGTGRSRENWLFEATWRLDGTERSEPLIARRDPLGGLLETDRSTEFAVLRALDTTDVPAPKARWLDPTGEALGRPTLVMRREPGDCDYFVLNGDRPLAERVDLARRCIELWATVHAVDWQACGLGEVLHDPGPEAARYELAAWEAILRRDQLEPWPELELAFRWLGERAPRSDDTVVVHGDLKAGNLLLDGDRIVALLDWELVHLGDRHEDLGWITQPLRTREHLIPGAFEREDLLRTYELASGRPVDRDAVAWWNVFACLKTAVMQISGLRSYVEGRHDEPYAPTAPVLLALLDAVEGVV